MNDAFRMRPVYDVLLRGSQTMPIGLYHLQLATAEQLTRLHYSPGSIKAIKARLKTLADQGYAQADRIPTKAYKSPYYYTLGHNGMKYLEHLGYDKHEAWRAQKEVDKHTLFLDHTLEVNDLIISAALLHAYNPQYQLDQFIHERVLKRHPFRVTSNGGSVALIPDAFLDFHYVGTRLHLRLVLEHDRGTEGPQFFRKRIRAYMGLLESGAYKEFFATTKLTVAFTTFLGEQRVQQMRSWTETELNSANAPWDIGAAFLFAALPIPVSPKLWIEPHWQLAFRDHNEHYALLSQ